MKWYFSALAMIMAGASMAQPAFSPSKKLPVDMAVEREATNWPDIDKYSISPNGKYVQYIVENEPEGSSTLVLQAIEKDWKKTITGVDNCDISKDDDWVVFKKNDSLCLARLGTEKMITVPRVKNFELTEKNGTYAVIYLDDEKELVWRELDRNNEKRWAGCVNFLIDSKKDKLLLELEVNISDDGLNYALKWVDLKSEKEHIIWKDAYIPTVNIGWNSTGTTVVFTTFEPQSKDTVYSLHCYQVGDGKSQVVGRRDRVPNDFHFDGDGEQLAFRLSDTIWYYKRGAVNAIPLVTPQSFGPDGSVHLKDIDFTLDGRKLRFRVEIWEKKLAPVTNVNVDIWHYKDHPLQSDQSLELLSESYIAVTDIGKKEVIQVTEPRERIWNSNTMQRFALVEKLPFSNEWCWQVKDESKFYLVSLETGERRKIAIESRYYAPKCMISPHEDYLIYYDPARDGYCSYEIASGQTRLLTAKLNVSWRNESFYLWFSQPNPFLGRDPRPRGFAGWVDEDSLFLVYDSHDIWRLDPSGLRAPVNLTGGEGVKNNIIFTLYREANDKVLSSRKEWLFSAFNPSTKFAGFYQKKMGINTVQRLTMEPCSYGLFRKAKNSSVWIGSLHSPSEAVKILAVKDFMSMKPIKICNPQRSYQWYTSELVSWELPNGEVCQGALYKPDDLDTTQKYPMLFNYYQEESNEVFNFKRPDMAGSCSIDVPYWVSRGYLVFMPDIHYRIGYPGQSALESIVSAARFLGRRPYVDTMHMGLAGHSWGGFETNYIVTHSHLFAAAAEGAGVSDCISRYNSLSGINGLEKSSSQPLYEADQSRMGVTLWERPDLYIENSPVIFADRVTTPLLILHNKLDNAVPWLQGVELFTALRRLGKKVWMLQYDGEGHTLLKPENRLDYTTRLTQFFDHYLKGAPAPKWMVDGIPRYMKGVDSGLELDTTGREP